MMALMMIERVAGMVLVLLLLLLRRARHQRPWLLDRWCPSKSRNFLRAFFER
jgi:Flp pilus assembly protein protease CpaA